MKQITLIALLCTLDILCAEEIKSPTTTQDTLKITNLSDFLCEAVDAAIKKEFPRIQGYVVNNIDSHVKENAQAYPSEQLFHPILGKGVTSFMVNPSGHIEVRRYSFTSFSDSEYTRVKKSICQLFHIKAQLIWDLLDKTEKEIELKFSDNESESSRAILSAKTSITEEMARIRKDLFRTRDDLTAKLKTRTYLYLNSREIYQHLYLGGENKSKARQNLVREYYKKHNIPKAFINDFYPEFGDLILPWDILADRNYIWSESVENDFIGSVSNGLSLSTNTPSFNFLDNDSWPLNTKKKTRDYDFKKISDSALSYLSNFESGNAKSDMMENPDHAYILPLKDRALPPSKTPATETLVNADAEDPRRKRLIAYFRTVSAELLYDLYQGIDASINALKEELTASLSTLEALKKFEAAPSESIKTDAILAAQQGGIREARNENVQKLWVDLKKKLFSKYTERLNEIESPEERKSKLEKFALSIEENKFKILRSLGIATTTLNKMILEDGKKLQN